MVNATNVSQKEFDTPLKIGGKVLSEAEIQECLLHGGIILSSGDIAMPMSEEKAIESKFKVRNACSLGHFVEIVRNIKSGKYTQDDIAFILKEGRLNIRTAYGVYMSMCMEKDIKKKITWRTFYMQCNEYRTLKPNTMEAIARFVVMMVGD